MFDGVRQSFGLSDDMPSPPGFVLDEITSLKQQLHYFLVPTPLPVEGVELKVKSTVLKKQNSI